MVIANIKFERFNEGGCHPIVHGSINGLQARFLLDTGASLSTVCVHKIGKYVPSELLFSEGKTASGLGTNSVEIKSVIVESMAVGDNVLSARKIQCVDLNYVHNHYDMSNVEHIDGIIGMDIMEQCGMIINFANGYLELQDA